MVRIVNDSFNNQACFNMNYHTLSLTIIKYRGLNTFKFKMIVEDSFCSLNKQMIANDIFLVSSFTKNRLKQKWQMVK